MVLNTQFMGKFRQGVMAVAAGLAMTGCNEARADDNTQAEVQKVAAVVETMKVTRDQCIALATKAEKIECMKKLKAQRVAEIATKTEVLATEKSNNEEKRTTVDLLNKEIDAVYVEAAQGSGTK